MQVNKLKKSLGLLYATKIGFDMPFFFVQEKQDSTEQKNSLNLSKPVAAALFNFPFLSSLAVKHPVRVTFFKTLNDFLKMEVVPVFISFKEFVVVKDIELIKISAAGLNTFCNTEGLFKQDKEFIVYERVRALTIT
jgi:hypothetical protein